MERLQMLIDCDPGVDDAIALMVAAQRANLIGITTVNGNVGIDATTHNALAVMEVVGLDVPVHRGAARPLISPTVDARHVHGPTGLGSVEIPQPRRAETSADAIDFICDMARTIPHLHLVAIGPLTNIALALRKDPSLPNHLGGFTIMGGAQSGGNVTASAEFNIWADPEAAAIVFAEMGLLTMVGLDLTHQVLLGDAERKRLRAAGTPCAVLAADLLDHAVARAGEIRGWSGAPIHDATAVLAALDPSLFGGHNRSVSVELNGAHTRGMTVVDERPGGIDGMSGAPINANVLDTVDAETVVAEIVDAVIALDPR